MTLPSAYFSAVRSHFSRAVAWLPWLIVALLVTWLLWPEWTTPLQLLYQSPPVSPPPTDTPVPPPPTNTPVPPPTDTPVPSPPTDTPMPPTGETPTEVAIPTDTPTTEAPTPVIETITPTLAQEIPTQLPSVDTQQAADTGTGKSVINWTKFWDTVAVVVAYPWLCCGIALLLLVPIAFLYLEIRGRRRPPKLPEPLQRKAGKEEPKEPA